MSGFFQRMSTVFRAKADKALDKVEDPRETLDYSYQRQLELLQKVRRGVADVATSRKRVELQANQLNTQIDKLNTQAQKALEVGREDLAREALTRKSGIQGQLGELQAQHAQLQGEEEKLVKASQRLQAKVDAFRTKKETIKATYSAAEAQTRINEAFSGIGEEMGDVGLAVQRAEDKTAQMQARAGAMDELLASGVLDDVTGSTKDDITRELEALSSTSDVDNELAQMKAQLGSGGAGQRQAIGQGPGYAQGAGQQGAQQQAPGQAGQFGQAGPAQQGQGQQGHAMPAGGDDFQAYPTQQQPGTEGQR
ncbi:PspA/IM30 family protein [Naumannella sp. ID2617S]|nr:PspA/IM30 family protein [Naumannella sp. ID2617S]